MSVYDSPSRAFVAQVGRSVSIEQAAQFLGVSRRTVYNRIKDGSLATLQTPWGSRRVLVDSLRRLKGNGPRDLRWLGLAR